MGRRIRKALSAMLLVTVAGKVAAVANSPSIELDLRPRICTLSAKDRQCEAAVQAKWKSPRDESLCLVIVGRPEIKRCWERYSEGVYSVELVFSEDLVVELRDPELKDVLASRTLMVIREALQFRHRRRPPWSIF